MDDKLAVGVTCDTDLSTVKTTVKEKGKQLKADLQLGPKIIEPLKMQSAEQLSDFAIQFRIMMVRPDENVVVRRRAQ